MHSYPRTPGKIKAIADTLAEAVISYLTNDIARKSSPSVAMKFMSLRCAHGSKQAIMARLSRSISKLETLKLMQVKLPLAIASKPFTQTLKSGLSALVLAMFVDSGDAPREPHDYRNRQGGLHQEGCFKFHGRF
jgi:hypothetical protein